MDGRPLLSEPLEQLLAGACERAAERGQALCDAEQVLEVLLLQQGEHGAARPLTFHLDRRPQLPYRPPTADLSRAVRTRALDEARTLAREDGRDEVFPEHLLHALLGPASPVAGALRDQALRGLKARRARTGAGPDPTPAPVPVPAGGPAGATPGHERFVVPLIVGDEDADLVDRPELTDRVLQTLLFGSALLVGPPGSGRRSLVRLVLRRIAQGKVPPAFARARLFALDPTRLVAGTSYRGELEERVQQALDALAAEPDRAVLVVEDLHLLVDSGASRGGIDVAAALAPGLRNGTLRVIGTTTQDDLRERLESRPALLDQLTTVPVPAPDRGEALRLLGAVPSRLQRSFGVAVSADAPAVAVRLCLAHLPHHALPGAACRLLSAAAARLSFETAMLERDPDRKAAAYWGVVGAPAGDRAAIGERHVLLALSQLHRIPFEHLESGVEQKIRGLDDAFRAHIFGQDQVLPVLSRTVKVALMNLADPRRPRGRMFFLGPPGTGKTESARLLAQYLMGSESALLRFDMSDYQEASAVSTLLGSDKGLVGSEEGGRLTEPLREDPHRVILFDEIEKAHPHIFNLFLQILDNGEIRDKRGCLVSFRHALILFTSNAGCSAEQGLVGATRAEIAKRLGAVFRPEFLNRIEDFVPFAPLDRDARRRVAVFQLERLGEQLERTHAMRLVWDDAVLETDALEPAGEAGARGVLRWVQGEVKPAIVERLLHTRREHAPGDVVRLGRAADGTVAAVVSEGTAPGSAPAATDGGAIAGIHPETLLLPGAAAP